MAPAVQHVLGIMGLLEEALSYLDFFDVFKAQLVNRTWRDCVAHSGTLTSLLARAVKFERSRSSMRFYEGDPLRTEAFIKFWEEFMGRIAAHV